MTSAGTIGTIAGAAGFLTLGAAYLNVTGPSTPLLSNISGALTGWSTAQISPKWYIGGRPYWVTTWEGVSVACGIILIILGQKYLGWAAFLIGILLVFLAGTGFLFGWPFGS